ncbi:hypothetical protein APHAL10511_006045 [Amanita phalloides]|nr:hypothetical protein APHAL10511_006045 [Amanita phalloides]
MLDTPYTTADEDPFHVSPLIHRHRSPSTLLDKWIRDQNFIPSVPPEMAASAVDTYLYPDDPSVHSYDLVQDDDIPDSPPPDSKLLHRAASFRNFNLPFRPNSSVHPSSPTNDSSRSSSCLSFLAKNSRPPASSASSGDSPHSHHARSSSLSTVQGVAACASPRSSIATVSSRWKPNVLGHFSSPSMSSQISVPTPPNDPYTPPRPSVSSADTILSGGSDNDLGHLFSKLSLLDTFRLRGDPSKSHIASSSSLWSQSQTTHTSVPSSSDSPSSMSHFPGSQRSRNSAATFRPYAPAFNEELDEIDEESEPSHLPVPETSTRPQIAYSSGSRLSLVRFPSLARRHKKKRRLVVSGIKPNDVRKFESLKQWCENFGEVSQITRMPNNDLHIHFRRADVAETVCRLRATVYINGVGSVQLSWIYGDKH